MILEFTIANMLSFKNKTTFSMLANTSNGLNNNYVTIDNKRILKTSAIYGGNASGKSNLFKILANVINMLKNSNSMDINSQLPIIPFKLDVDSIKNPSEFEIKFIIEKIKYVYGWKADAENIYDEYLYYYPNGRETKIFDRTKINKYSFPQKDEKTLREIEKKNANNKFFLATATNWNFEKTRVAYEFLTTNIRTCFNIEEFKSASLNIYETEDENLRSFALDFLKKTDFNIEDYKVSRINLPEDIINSMPELLKQNFAEKFKIYQVLIKHKGTNEYLTLEEESLGTQIIFSLIPFIADTIENNKILIIDELDKSLHPFLVHYIVETFNNTDTNKTNSQLIFNTHDTNLLDLNILRRDQIWFTEKNNETGESDLYALSDFSVRKSENIEKGYLLGRYGAVPFIKNDINIWEEE